MTKGRNWNRLGWLTLVTAGLLASGRAVAGETLMKPCPDSPNCVSSLREDGRNYIRPLVFEGDAEAAWSRLQSVVAGMTRAKVVTVTGTYLHAEFRSALFRFVDDVEFELDVDGGYIHVRSASRVGYWDLGANRKRVETIRRAFDAMPMRQDEVLPRHIPLLAAGYVLAVPGAATGVHSTGAGARSEARTWLTTAMASRPLASRAVITLLPMDPLLV